MYVPKKFNHAKRHSMKKQGIDCDFGKTEKKNSTVKKDPFEPSFVEEHMRMLSDKGRSAVRQGEIHFEQDGFMFDCIPLTEEETEEMFKKKENMRVLKEGEIPELGVWYRDLQVCVDQPNVIKQR